MNTHKDPFATGCSDLVENAHALRLIRIWAIFHGGSVEYLLHTEGFMEEITGCYLDLDK